MSVYTPVFLPYAGTSGWSGTDTSQDRATQADESGVTGRRQSELLAYLRAAGPVGMTWKDYSDTAGHHHGTASGTLSVLHKAGQIARLTEKRDKCLVYVSPEFIQGRTTTEQGRKHPCPNCGHQQ